MSSQSVSDIQTRAEGESLYIKYRSDANVRSYLKNDPSDEFIGEVILKINSV
jgi:DNA-dependent RNA polymerase auxiliary subunit epsilon